MSTETIPEIEVGKQVIVDGQRCILTGWEIADAHSAPLVKVDLKKPLGPNHTEGEPLRISRSRSELIEEARSWLCWEFQDWDYQHPGEIRRGGPFPPNDKESRDNYREKLGLLVDFIQSLFS